MLEYCCPECLAEFKTELINVVSALVLYCPVCKAKLGEPIADDGEGEK